MQNFTNKHNEKVKYFRVYVNAFKDVYEGYTGKDIKTEWLKNYAPSIKPDEVVGMYDTTTLGKGKKGFLLTDDYLYWNLSSSKGELRLKDVERVTYYDENQKKDKYRGVVFHLKDSSRVYWDGYCSFKCKEFIKFMNGYLAI